LKEARAHHLSGQISSSVNKLSSESFCDNWVWFQLVQVPSYKPTFRFRIRIRWSWWWCWKWVWRGWFVESVRDSCFARMMTRRKRLCVSNTCLPHEISMEKAFANCSYGNAAHDEEGIETLGIVYLVRWVFLSSVSTRSSLCFLPKITWSVVYTRKRKKKKKKTLLRVCRRDSVIFFFLNFLKCFF